MVRLYLIGAIILMVVLMWMNGTNVFAHLIPIQSKVKVTNAMVEEKMKPYVHCMNTELIIVKEAFNGPINNKTASANTVRIVKGCDGHLKQVMNWLSRMGELNSKINQWANRMRQRYLDQVFNYLTTGMIADREYKEDSSHK